MQEDTSKQKKQQSEAVKDISQKSKLQDSNPRPIYLTMEEHAKELEDNRRRLSAELFQSDEDWEEACAIYAEQIEHWLHHNTDELPPEPCKHNPQL
tara:strand:+ start:1393 stop:1680 length:288 start_codon:yes stop_codon:yes gene_type:complete